MLFTAAQEYIPPLFTGLKYCLDCRFILASRGESVLTGSMLTSTQESQKKIESVNAVAFLI